MLGKTFVHGPVLALAVVDQQWDRLTESDRETDSQGKESMIQIFALIVLRLTGAEGPLGSVPVCQVTSSSLQLARGSALGEWMSGA